MENERLDRLYDRAWAILDGRATGFGMPIMEALARRQHPSARSALADLLGGSISARTRARGRNLTRLSALRGDPYGAYNLAMSHLNDGDMRLYRRWLTIAAKVDPEARAELRAFHMRHPHTAMRRLKRLSPR